MPSILQDILIILLPMYALIDNRGITIVNHWPVTVGFFAGLIMGDLQSALVIAGTFQLMSLGVAALGGSSVPDYALATVVAIYLNARTGATIGTAVAIGLPVGIIAINLDVLTRTLNSFVSEKAKQYLEKKQFKKMQNVNFISVFFVSMQAFIPMIILVVFGPTAVETIIKITPDWFTNGLNIAGGMLPVVGFVIAAYMKLPILAISIVGFALGVYVYKDMISKKQMVTNNTEAVYEGGVDFDE